MVDTVERKIHFFRAITPLLPTGEHAPFDHAPIFSRLANIPFTFPGRYAQEENGYVFAWLEDVPDNRLVFGRSRRRGLPRVEAGGTFTALGIPTTSGLAEVSHVMFFPRNIVAAEFNHFAPRTPSLARYLRQKCPAQCPEVTFAPLLAPDIGAELASMDSIKWATIRVTRPYVAQVQAASESLGAAFAAATNIGNAQDVEIILRPQRYSRGRLDIGIRGLLNALRGLNAAEPVITSLKVEGEIDGESRIVDLLEDRLVVGRRVVQVDERTRAVDPSSAFEMIQDAYGEVREVAEVAPAVRLGVQ